MCRDKAVSYRGVPSSQSLPRQKSVFFISGSSLATNSFFAWFLRRVSRQLVLQVVALRYTWGVPEWCRLWRRLCRYCSSNGIRLLQAGGASRRKILIAQGLERYGMTPGQQTTVDSFTIKTRLHSAPVAASAPEGDQTGGVFWGNMRPKMRHW